MIHSSQFGPLISFRMDDEWRMENSSAFRDRKENTFIVSQWQ